MERIGTHRAISSIMKGSSGKPTLYRRNLMTIDMSLKLTRTS